jgi:hypothetical protein
MRTWEKTLAHVAWNGLLFSGLSAYLSPLAAQQLAAASAGQNSELSSQKSLVTRAEVPAGNESNASELPDSPGAVATKSGDAAQQQDATQPAAAPAPSQSTATPSQQPAVQRPLGTAAAEAPNASGVAASQPSGVAIAPGKQHRARTILIRTGAIIGAGVALGAVVALTEATPSKPPGAH